MTVKRNGIPVKVDSFSLTGSDVTVNIDLTGNEGMLLEVNLECTQQEPLFVDLFR